MLQDLETFLAPVMDPMMLRNGDWNFDSSVKTDVVIVGAGIGGSVLALALARRGWRIAVVEREKAPQLLVRPEILWSPTTAALETLGVADAIRNTSVRLEEILLTTASRTLLAFDERTFLDAAVSAFSTNPSKTRALILDAALATGLVEIHRGVTIDELVRKGSRVVGVRGLHDRDPFTLESSLVVGDDGVQSVVRKKLGIELALTEFPIDLVTTTVRWPSEMPPRRARAWIRPQAFREGLPAAILIPWSEDRGVLLVPIPHERAERFLNETPERFWREMEALTPLGAALRAQLDSPRSFARVQRPFGHAPSYVTDAAALIGDAAHPMTPAGGQGANASIWDALALADVANAALRSGDVSRERLLRYEQLRRPVNERSVSISRLARLIFRFGGWLPVATLLPLIAPLVPRRRVLRSFATTFVTPGSI